MQIKVIASLKFIEYSNLKAEFKLKNFTISKNKDIVREMFDEKTLQAYGSIEFESMKNDYIISFLGNCTEISSGATLAELIPALYGQIELVVNSLWIIKDNSISVYSLMLEIVKTEEKGLNGLYIVNSNAAGEMTSTNFTMTDIADVRKYLPMIYKFRTINSDLLNALSPFDENEPMKGQDRDLIYNLDSSNRISSALWYIHSARKSRSIAGKIKDYMQALESLFNISRADTSKIILSRINDYYQNCDGEFCDIQPILDDAYKIRSKILHSQLIDGLIKDKPKLKLNSLQMDSVLRTIMRRVLTTDSDFFVLSSQELHAYYRNKERNRIRDNV